MKQRLLGAAVLVALAIIFVPMFLSGPGPKTSSETANLQAPPTPDRRFQERTLSLDLPPAGQSPVTTAPAAMPEPAPDPNRITTIDTATAPKPEPLAEQASVEAPASVATTPPEASPAPATTPKPDLAETPVETVPGTAANGSFFVHMGDYGAQKNASDLAATLNKAGYSAFTESSTFGGKPTLRVRVGPFANRADAEATRLRISQTNVRAPASVVQNASDAKTPEAVAPKPAAEKSDSSAAVASPPAGKASGWVVQLNAFTDVDDANKLRDIVRNGSFPAYVDKVTREGRTLWRVRVGPQADRASAEAVQARLRERLKQDGVVVANP